MPRKPRSEEEIEQVRERILAQALDLIREWGFEGFTMRRLAGRLGVKPVTIYRYYQSKDHIYLAVLTRGFQLLHRACIQAYEAETDPLGRLERMMRAYLAFGLEQANFYNLMFTWHVPKYEDYLGTSAEAAARHELEESQRILLLFIRAVEELMATVEPGGEDWTRAAIIYFWSTLHGYIAGVNNRLLAYMHPDPLALKEVMLENLFAHIRGEIDARRTGPGEAASPVRMEGRGEGKDRYPR